MKNIELIAEIGWNHQGDMDLAKKMAYEAKKSGADFAKFQTWSVSRLRNGEWDHDGRRKIYEKAELTKANHEELIKYCNKIGINFLSSAFSKDDAKLLFNLGVKRVKIPSFESRNRELIEYCYSNFDHMYVSTGTSSLDEISSIFKTKNPKKFTLLHCVSSYPCDYKNANLPKMLRIQKQYGKAGYSDHILGVESAKIAYLKGVTVIEKHFTIDKNLPGRDNKFSILPEEMNNLSEFIKNYQVMMVDHGTGYQDLEVNQRNFYSGRFNG
jgi:sialic acid synthase SpsE